MSDLESRVSVLEQQVAALQAARTQSDRVSVNVLNFGKIDELGRCEWPEVQAHLQATYGEQLAACAVMPQSTPETPAKWFYLREVAATLPADDPRRVRISQNCMGAGFNLNMAHTYPRLFSGDPEKKGELGEVLQDTIAYFEPAADAFALEIDRWQRRIRTLPAFNAGEQTFTANGG